MTMFNSFRFFPVCRLSNQKLKDGFSWLLIGEYESKERLQIINEEVIII